jgi:hypothetical protein
MKTELPKEFPVQADQLAQAPLARSTIDRPTNLVRRRKGFSVSKLGVDCSRLDAAGWHCHWFNDEDNRVENALDNGYIPVYLHEVDAAPSSYGAPTTDGGTRVSRRVGIKEDGTPLTAHLMKTSKEFHQENQSMYQERCDRIDQQIRAGTVKQSTGEPGGSITDPESGTRFYSQVAYSTPRSR